jgi:hypothetical protein
VSREPVRIAVIAAPNPRDINPGMVTVDLAAASVLKRIAPSATPSWYTLHLPNQFGPVHPYLNPRELPFAWQPLVEHFDEVCGHDVVLLWGDFLQARHYFVEDAAARLVLGSGRRMSATQALDTLYRCLLFRDAAPEVLSKIFIYGSSILFNRQTDYSADRYGEYVSRLLRHCGGVWARDPISAAKIQHLRQDYTSMFLGTDAAFLLRDDDLASLSTTSWIGAAPFSDRVGLFVGARTRAPRTLLRFVQQVAQRLELHLEWLPWFPVHEWLRAGNLRRWSNPVMATSVANRRRKIDRLMTRGIGYSAGDLLAAIGQYRFIVTDTYHLCVNAWRAGRPAICFGNSELASKPQTLADYKKRVLYEMYDASDFYFSTSSLESAASKKQTMEKMLKLMSDDSIARPISERIRAHVCAIEEAVAKRLSGFAAR